MDSEDQDSLDEIPLSTLILATVSPEQDWNYFHVAG